MSALVTGLILVLLFHVLLFALLLTVARLLPTSCLGKPARAVIHWMPPFLGGAALRDWAATAAEQQAQRLLAGRRNGNTANRLASELEAAAMQAMLPLAEREDLERIVACPKTGQGLVGVTAPEALALAAHLRQHKSRAEQARIHRLAVENAKQIASRPHGDASPYPCSLQGADHVCCVFSQRPLRCRPLHAICIAQTLAREQPAASRPATAEFEERHHEHLVAQGIEAGMSRALRAAGLDANLYELNSALAVALEEPDAAERWARGENVFQHARRLN